jgi:hypothetical protein
MFSKRVRKTIAAFFLLLMVQSAVVPCVSYALTAGPTAPEFSSFEPVDTTDMVNLATGELVYNTPLLEIPGPEGGYPLSLSYHAGIKMDQEASWVGLGWTLNPGAINRTVNGYADDNVETKKEVRDYWGGGEQTTKTYNLGFSIPNTGIGLNYSLARTRDTYKGFSTYHKGGISGSPGNTGVNLNFSYDSKGVWGLDASKGVAPQTNVGISMSSNGVKTNISVAGESLMPQQGSNFAGDISSYTNETDIGTIIMGPGSFSLKNFYTRYWSDETQGLRTYGTLYPEPANDKIGADYTASDNEFISYAFDIYDIFDDQPIEETEPVNLNDATDASKQLGGSLPAYDQYDVLGQGIGGVIRPHIFENGDLNGQSYYLRDHGRPATSRPTFGYKSLRKFSNRKVGFRFLNDFSNALTISTPNFEVDNQILTVDEQTVHANSQGFNNIGENTKLAGSRHVEWFTNSEIRSGLAQDKGFIDCYQNKNDRKVEFDIYDNYLQPEAGLPYEGYFTYGRAQGSFKDDTYGGDPMEDIAHSAQYHSLKPTKVDLGKKIGGFMITNETGVTYHYAQPVYAYNEYTRSKLKKPRKGVSTFREYKNNDPYAYTWLLTAITGPDYVDRNNNGTLDDADWGYWVKFDYGRWADSYQWRTPHTGYIDDIESEYATFSYGIKELYYLDAIETRSHKAVFIKSKRKDGRGVTSRLEGGSKPRFFRMNYYFGDLDYAVSPVSTMKLDAVYLFNKDELATISVTKADGLKYKEATSTTAHPYPFLKKDGYDNYSYTIPLSNPVKVVTIEHNEDFVYVKYHNGDQVFDDDDIARVPQFKQKALRVIEFNTDYSTCKGVDNSIGYLSDLGYQCSYPSEECDVDNNFEWPKKFDCPDYILPTCCTGSEKFYSKFGLLSFYNNPGIPCESKNNSNLYAGDDLVYALTGKLTLKGIKILGRGGADVIPPTLFTYGENSDYDKDKYDSWGYYKSDYDTPTVPFLKKNREITTASAAHTDAWSLQSITMPTGAIMKVDYEANQYNKSVYNDFSIFSVLAIGPNENPDEVGIFFKEAYPDLSKWFAVNDPVDIKAHIAKKASSDGDPSDDSYLGSASDRIVKVTLAGLVINSPGLRAAISPSVFFGDAYFLGGYIKVDDAPDLKYAGGIRVKSLEIKSNDSGEINSTEYDYTDPTAASASTSSGVTSFKPYIQPSIHYPVDNPYFDWILTSEADNSARQKLEAYRIQFQKTINEPVKNILSFSREAPAPGAMYEYVTVRNSKNGIELDNHVVHHFKVFDAAMINKQVENISTTETEKRKVTIENNAVDVGSLLSTVVYNNQDEPIHTTQYAFLYDGINEPFENATLASKQSVVEQSFHKYITLRKYIFSGIPGYVKNKALITKRRDRANTITSVKETNHITGLVTETQNHAFDFYSGQVTKTLTKDSYGNRVLSTTVPAYKKYPQMGLKIFDVHNKNMLTQSTEQFTTRVNEQNEALTLLSASVQTWSETVPVIGQPVSAQSNIWRKEATYNWTSQQELNTDGTMPYVEYHLHPFDRQNPVSPYWEKSSQTTLYDMFSHDLEAKDINGHFAAVRMDSKQQKVVASAANASYFEFAYSGAEDPEESLAQNGGIERNSGSRISGQAHTGSYSLLVPSGATGFKYKLSSAKADLSKKYRASVWVYAPGNAETQSELDKIELYYLANAETKIHPTLQKSKSKSWYLLTLDIDPAGANEVSIGVRNNAVRGVYFDDFRVHPLDGAMTSYVYDPSTDELTYILDTKNFYTRFEYDEMGRLIRTSKELLNFDYGAGKESFRADAILKEVKYNYKKP